MNNSKFKYKMESELNNLKVYRKWLEENGVVLNNVRK